MNNKQSELRKVSDPEIVSDKACRMGLNEVHPSSRKDKKYMVFDGNKMIHFGQMGYEDYTYTGDKLKRDRFRKRNWKWQNSPRYSPAFLSWNLLW